MNVLKEAVLTTNNVKSLCLKSVHKQTQRWIFRLEGAATDPGNSTDLEAGAACFAAPLELKIFRAFGEQCLSASSRQILKPWQNARVRACALNFYRRLEVISCVHHLCNKPTPGSMVEHRYFAALATRRHLQRDQSHCRAAAL